MRFEIYEANDGWRWRLRASNNMILADGGEAYVTKSGALRGVRALVGKLRRESVKVNTGEGSFWIV